MAEGDRPIPLLGLGTWQIKDEQILKAVIPAAVEAGYKLIDTAAVYGNESIIGDILKGLNRDELFITTKLAPRDHGYDKAKAALEQSLANLQLSHVDLYLVHWPAISGRDVESPENPSARKGTWQALEELQKQGKTKYIGVSNYTVDHLKELLSYATIKPAVLQSECHPQQLQTEVREFCKSNGIFFQAYSSLGIGHLIDNPVVTLIAKEKKRTNAQVLLRWAVQQGMGVIPKASSVSRVVENSKIFDFELTQEEMEKLCALDKNSHFCWDPNKVK